MTDPLSRLDEQDAEARNLALSIRRLVAREGGANDATLRALLVELGLQRHLIPAALGGGDGTPAEAAPLLGVALEEVGRADAGLALALAATLGTAAVARERPALAERLCAEEALRVAPILTALAEESADDAEWLDGRRLQLRAYRRGAALRLEGARARPLWGGRDADLLLALCALEGEGPVLVAVAANAEGIVRGEAILQTGLASVPNARVSLDGVSVAAEQLLGGREAERALLGWLRLGIAEAAAGAAEAGASIVQGWAEIRVIKGRGQRFLDNPLTASLLAGAFEQATLARLQAHALARQLGAQPEGDESLAELTSLLARHAVELAAAGLESCMELMGSAGYATEWQLERRWRDLQTLRAILGAPHQARLELARRRLGSRALEPVVARDVPARHATVPAAIGRPLETSSPMEALLGRVVRRWAEREVLPVRRRFDEDWREHRLVEPALRRLMGELGLQRALFPEALGGWGLGASHAAASATMRLLEEIARADSGIAVAVGVTFWPLLMICRPPHVNARLCAELAPLFCGTSELRLAANAMTEPQGGADIENLDLLGGSTLTTSARLEGGEWVIRGHKLWPTNTGGAASLLGVVCSTCPGSRDPRDFAFILVPGDRPGVVQGGPYEKAGMAADRNGDVWFEDVRVPAWYRACGPGEDFRWFKEVVAFGNLGSIAFVSGVLQDAHALARALAARVRWGGRPLRENDAAAAVLADLASSAEAVRNAGYQLARVLDRGDLYGEATSESIVARGRALKYQACDQGLDVLARTIELFEGLGVERESDLEKHWRDLEIVKLWMGGKQLCQMETARYFFGCETL
jgi:alkylation response protein AidB-like acyl-CoA dehydrogenase